MKKMLNNSKGITLIALVVTIVVLLILAGVSISTLTGDNGIIKQSQEAKERTKYEGAKEKFDLVILDVRAGKLEKNQKFLLSDSLAAEIESYEEIESATFVGEKIEAIVDGYTFEVTGDVEEDGSIKKVEGSTDDWEWYVDPADNYAVLTKYKKVGTVDLVVPNYIDGHWVKKIEIPEGNYYLWSDSLIKDYECGTLGVAGVQETIKSIKISEGIVELGREVFVNAIYLEELYIPKSVSIIEDRICNRWSDLVELYYDSIKYSDITINVEYLSNEIPNTWNENWDSVGEGSGDIIVNYGATMP